MTKNHYEIIICGAGMIGLTFALLMAEKKIKVCIIDKNNKISQSQDADNIIVMNEGSIIEAGKHDDLLKEGGLYADLWKVQSGATYSN